MGRLSLYPRDSPFLMFASNPQDTVPMEVPKAAGYYLDVLHTSHASLLASQWGEFIQDGCVEYLASQIQHVTSIAVYQSTKEVCSTLPLPSNHSGVKVESYSILPSFTRCTTTLHDKTNKRETAGHVHSPIPVDGRLPDETMLKEKSGPIPSAIHTSSSLNDDTTTSVYSGLVLQSPHYINTHSAKAQKEPIGYCIASDDLSLISMNVSPKHRGKGLAEWITKELIKKMHSFNFPGIALIYPENYASQRLALRCGMSQCAGKWYWLEFVPHGQCISRNN